MKLILIAGMPATGKSHLAEALKNAFGLPVIEKDEIKEQLFDTIGFTCYAEKRQLDVAATSVLLKLMERLYEADASAIVVNNFTAEAGEKLNAFLKRDGVRCFTLFLNGDPQILYERYYERDKKGLRHPGHAMQIRYPSDSADPEVFDMSREGFDQRFLKLGMDKAGWDGPILYLDATYPETIDTDAVILETSKALDIPIRPKKGQA